jgi:MYXO-CTERM domain-containing protein
VPAELQQTGDDGSFFSLAEQAGIRVVTSLNAWNPRQVTGEADAPMDITWASALLALVLLIAGFALRRR